MTEAHLAPRSHRIDPVKSIPFFLVHVAAVALVWHLGWSWSGFGLALGLYALRMFGVTAGYHRYFSHRSYKTSRVFQFILAILAMTSVQKGVLWWASHHRAHHKYSDKPEDVHSVKQDGFWWSHVGWILSNEYDATDLDRVRDLARYPELRVLDRLHLLVSVGFAVLCYLLGGLWGLSWGFFVSTSLLWHGTFTINSLTHMFGKARYVTGENSKNNFWLALITLGEGWHNNHHYYQRATNQGFFWWELDVTYYVLKLLELCRVVWDVHTPPAHVRDSNRVPLPGAPAAPLAPVAPAPLAEPAE
jgi:stearoyl-CoA desaturase (delta-9 desaturase)